MEEEKMQIDVRVLACYCYEPYGDNRASTIKYASRLLEIEFEAVPYTTELHPNEIPVDIVAIKEGDMYTGTVSNGALYKHDDEYQYIIQLIWDQYNFYIIVLDTYSASIVLLSDPIPMGYPYTENNVHEELGSVVDFVMHELNKTWILANESLPFIHTVNGSKQNEENTE